MDPGTITEETVDYRGVKVGLLLNQTATDNGWSQAIDVYKRQLFFTSYVVNAVNNAAGFSLG